MAATEGLPSGTVTFLFTDIQGSTELWDAFPDEMRAALATHDRIMGEAIAGAGGSVVKNTGDGIFAAFASAPGAVAAAVDAQTKITLHEWDPVIGSLEVRMALHTDAIEVADGDYHGPAINRVARIEAAGHGGQILLSDATKEAASPALPDDVDVLDLGTHTLRGLSSPETIHQLVVPGLRSSFPRLRTASVAIGRLPEFATSFVGRVADIDALGERLSDPNCRVVTALGPGGIGKTRLSVEAARRIADETSAVAHCVFLAGVSNPASISREIADSLNFTIDLHVISVTDETTQVLDLLRNQRLILVLDNFEHLLQGAGLITRIVESAPDVKVLVTSRERLGIGSEWIYEVGGLDAHGDSDQLTDAVALFIDRARQAGAEISTDDLEAVAAICKAVGGMPLAIELAAAWASVLPVDEIASEVGASLDFLSGALTDVPERHRSVRAAFDHSWRRLPDELRQAFSRLAVFPAPFTREAANYVAGTSLTTLLDLMNKSLMRRADFYTYDIHPLLREFGLEHLGDEREAIAGRHGKYYTERLLQRSERLLGPEQNEVKDEVAADLENLRPATLWAVDNLSTEDFVGVLHALKHFYFLYSWAEAVNHFAELADTAEAAVGTVAALDDERYLWARTLSLVHLADLGNVDSVTGELTRLLPHWERGGGGVGLATALVGLGEAAEQSGDLVESRRVLERAAEVGLGSDRLLQIRHRAWYGYATLEQGDVEKAQEILREGVAVAEEINHYSGRAYMLSKLGTVADALGNHQQAAEYHHESREMFVKTGDLAGQGYTLSRLSWSYWLMCDYVEAKRYGEESLDKFEEINHQWGVAASWCRIGLADLGLGEIGAAGTAFRTGLDLALGEKLQTLVYYALMGLGRVYAAEGDTSAAVRLLTHNVEAPQNPYVGLAQEALDDLADQATEAMREAGTAMTLDEAIALARENQPGGESLNSTS